MAFAMRVMSNDQARGEEGRCIRDVGRERDRSTEQTPGCERTSAPRWCSARRQPEERWPSVAMPLVMMAWKSCSTGTPQHLNPGSRTSPTGHIRTAEDRTEWRALIKTTAAPVGQLTQKKNSVSWSSLRQICTVKQQKMYNFGMSGLFSYCSWPPATSLQNIASALCHCGLKHRRSALLNMLI